MLTEDNDHHRLNQRTRLADQQLKFSKLARPHLHAKIVLSAFKIEASLL